MTNTTDRNERAHNPADPPRIGQVTLVTGGATGLGLAIAQTGITVNALAPGPFRTPLNDQVDDDPHVQRFLDTEVPLRRWAAPIELTGAALLLTDPQAGYLTGVVLPIDGGWTAH